MPEIWGVHLSGALTDWVSAKDVALEMLRHHGVEGGFGRIIEYYGPGLACLSAMDRHVIVNLGAEMGATTTVFPSDDRTREFLAHVGREADRAPYAAEPGAQYDCHDEIDLDKIEPMIALPSSPANVVRVRDVPKQDIYQVYVGSSANPGYRDFAIAAAIVASKTTHDRVSFDINPSTREVFQQLVADGRMAESIAAGARVHQPGCNGCIGMGQAPRRRTRVAAHGAAQLSWSVRHPRGQRVPVQPGDGCGIGAVRHHYRPARRRHALSGYRGAGRHRRRHPQDRAADQGRGRTGDAIAEVGHHRQPAAPDGAGRRSTTTDRAQPGERRAGAALPRPEPGGWPRASPAFTGRTW